MEDFGVVANAPGFGVVANAPALSVPPLTFDPGTVVVVPCGLNCVLGSAAAPVGPLCAFLAFAASSLASISAFNSSTDFDGFLLPAGLPSSGASLKYDSCKN